MKFGLHVGEVAHPFTTDRTVVEGIGIGIDADALELAVNNACYHVLQLLVAVGELDIGPYLGSGVAEPHGMDIAGINESIVAAIGILAVVHGGIEGVGEAVLEHPCELGVLEHLLDTLDFLLDSFRLEKTCGFLRTVGHRIFCSGRCANGSVVAGADICPGGMERCAAHEHAGRNQY